MYPESIAEKLSVKWEYPLGAPINHMAPCLCIHTLAQTQWGKLPFHLLSFFCEVGGKRKTQRKPSKCDGAA